MAAGFGGLVLCAKKDELRTPGARMPFARHLVESGQKTVKEGMADWNK